MKLVKVLFLFLFLTVGMISCQGSGKPAADGDKVREYAGDLINRSLFVQAITVYQTYLDDYKIPERERANVNYIIANTYFERMKDYENALSYYLKIKHLFPEESLMPEVNKRIIACLERLERSEDAQQVLDETVQMDPDKVVKKRPGEVVAQIGNRSITMGDLEFEINQLPPSVRDQFKSKDSKLEFLREYVATELLYDTAKRSGLDKDPDVVEGSFQAKKSLMVRKLLQERVAVKVSPTQSEIELYYEAHKDEFADKDANGNIVNQKSLAEVQDKVVQALSQKQFRDAYEGLVGKMINAEGVKFFESKIQ